MHTSDGFPISERERERERREEKIREGIIEEENRVHTDVIWSPMKQLRYEE